VALAVIKGEKTLAELGVQYGVSRSNNHISALVGRHDVPSVHTCLNALHRLPRFLGNKCDHFYVTGCLPCTCMNESPR